MKTDISQYIMFPPFSGNLVPVVLTTEPPANYRGCRPAHPGMSGVVDACYMDISTTQSTMVRARGPRDAHASWRNLHIPGFSPRSSERTAEHSWVSRTRTPILSLFKGNILATVHRGIVGALRATDQSPSDGRVR